MSCLCQRISYNAHGRSTSSLHSWLAGSYELLNRERITEKNIFESMEFDSISCYCRCAVGKLECVNRRRKMAAKAFVVPSCIFWKLNIARGCREGEYKIHKDA